jgi:hypothetical protein
MRLVKEFTLDGLPNLPNVDRYKHWAIRRKSTLLWKQNVFLACHEHKISGLFLATAKLTFIRRSPREPDYDNLVASFKACQDGLVAAGVVLDDKTKNIGQPSYLWIRQLPRHGGQITIRIETEEEFLCR